VDSLIVVGRPKKGAGDEHGSNGIYDGSTMNQFVAHISKAVMLLAVILLPIQQSLASACCCRGGQDCAKQTAAGSLASCGSHIKTSRRGSASDLSGGYYEESSLDSKTKSCHCPSECDAVATLGALDSAMGGSSLEDLSVETVLCVSATSPGNPARNSLGNAPAACPSSGSERCIWLCRYRL